MHHLWTPPIYIYVTPTKRTKPSIIWAYNYNVITWRHDVHPRNRIYLVYTPYNCFFPHTLGYAILIYRVNWDTWKGVQLSLGSFPPSEARFWLNSAIFLSENRRDVHKDHWEIISPCRAWWGEWRSKMWKFANEKKTNPTIRYYTYVGIHRYT